MAVKQYPHFLFVHQVSESTQDPETGDWWTPEDQWVMHSVCREETNGAGRMINGPDGQAIVFSSTVYLPRTAAKITEGTEVKVMESNDVNGFCRVSGKNLKFDASQLHARLWV